MGKKTRVPSDSPIPADCRLEDRLRTRAFSPTYPTWALVGGTSRPAGETVSTVRRTIFLWARKVSRDVRYFSSEQFINVNVFLYLLNHDQNRLGWNDEMRKLLLILVEIIERGTCIVWMWQTGNFNNQLRHKIIDSSWLIISTDPRFLAVVVPVSSLSYRTISNAKAAIVVTWVTPLVCVLPAWWAHNLHSYQTRKDLPISTKHNIHFNFSSYSYAYPSIRFNSTYIKLLYSKKRYA